MADNPRANPEIIASRARGQAEMRTRQAEVVQRQAEIQRAQVDMRRRSMDSKRNDAEQMIAKMRVNQAKNLANRPQPGA